jgi:glycosyltransferase involved in cell wall biosynthesis
VSIRIIADEPEAPDLADENAKGLFSHTRYLLPMKEEDLRKWKRYFFFRNPIRYLRLLYFVITHRYGPFKNRKRDFEVFSKAIYLAGILKEENITHLHSPWTDRCAFLSLLASKLLGIPYSVQSRAHEIHRHMYLFGLRENLQNARFVITNSEYNRSYLESIVGDHFQDRVIRIYNGVDLERFDPSSNHHENPEVFRMLCVARLIEQKGLLYLLKACRLIKDRGISFECEIIGGPEEEMFMNYLLETRKLYRQLDLEGCVKFSGKLPFEKILDKYKNSHIFVMPSVIGKDGSRDITPNSLIEAMAMKLPVISTTVTAIPEIVEDGISGLLVPPGDENALADAILKLIADAELRKRLGENARKKVESQFDITTNIRNYINLFSSQKR